MSEQRPRCGSYGYGCYECIPDSAWQPAPDVKNADIEQLIDRAFARNADRLMYEIRGAFSDAVRTGYGSVRITVERHGDVTLISTES